jgi:hypothetical protein
MSTLRTATEQIHGAHVCRSCTVPLVPLQDAERTGRPWLVQLYCPELRLERRGNARPRLSASPPPSPRTRFSPRTSST